MSLVLKVVNEQAHPEQSYKVGALSPHSHLPCVCGTYHTLCSDVMKNYMKLCNERNCNLVSEEIFHSFRVDRPSDAPESGRTNTSHAAESSDDDTPIKSSKQQPSSDRNSSKASTGKSQAGGTSSSDHGTSDSEPKSSSETLTPVSKTPAGLSKKASLGKLSDKHKHDHHKHKDSKPSCEHKSDHKSKHSSRKKEKKHKCSNSEGEGGSKHARFSH